MALDILDFYHQIMVGISDVIPLLKISNSMGDRTLMAGFKFPDFTPKNLEIADNSPRNGFGVWITLYPDSLSTYKEKLFVVYQFSIPAYIPPADFTEDEFNTLRKIWKKIQHNDSAIGSLALLRFEGDGILPRMYIAEKEPNDIGKEIADKMVAMLADIQNALDAI